MLFQQINRSDAEKVFIVAQAGAAVVYGQGVCFDHRATNSLGAAVMTAITSSLKLFAGVVQTLTGMAAGSFGLVQVYGYCASTVCHFGAASVSAAGLGLGPGNGLVSLQSNGFPSDGCGGIVSAVPFVVCMENDVSGPGYFKTFVRAM